MRSASPSLQPRTPVSWETPLGELLKPITPNETFYIRHHALAVPQVDRERFRLALAGGGVTQELSLAALRSLPRAREIVTLECAGNGRVSFDPKVPGVPWGFGAISTAQWEGAALRDVLALVERPPDAQHIVVEAHDGPVDANIPAYRRSLSLSRALGDGVLVADSMNGEPIAPEHGGPARLIVGGWTANHSVKWLRRISFAAAIDSGYWMALEYRVPDADGVDQIIEEPAPIAIIASPLEGAEISGRFDVQGVTFGHPVPASIRLDIDDGQSIVVAAAATLGRFAWASWQTNVELEPGLHRLQVRPVDARGCAGPAKAAWNARGYNYNGPHCVTVTVSG